MNPIPQTVPSPPVFKSSREIRACLVGCREYTSLHAANLLAHGIAFDCIVPTVLDPETTNCLDAIRQAYGTAVFSPDDYESRSYNVVFLQESIDHPMIAEFVSHLNKIRQKPYLVSCCPSAPGMHDRASARCGLGVSTAPPFLYFPCYADASMFGNEPRLRRHVIGFGGEQYITHVRSLAYHLGCRTMEVVPFVEAETYFAMLCNWQMIERAFFAQWKSYLIESGVDDRDAMSVFYRQPEGREYAAHQPSFYGPRWNGPQHAAVIASVYSAYGESSPGVRTISAAYAHEDELIRDLARRLRIAFGSKRKPVVYFVGIEHEGSDPAATYSFAYDLIEILLNDRIEIKHFDPAVIEFVAAYNRAGGLSEPVRFRSHLYGYGQIARFDAVVVVNRRAFDDGSLCPHKVLQNAKLVVDCCDFTDCLPASERLVNKKSLIRY
jgi:hypothetical protein